MDAENEPRGPEVSRLVVFAGLLEGNGAKTVELPHSTTTRTDSIPSV
jgi:hypothetical protein